MLRPKSMGQSHSVYNLLSSFLTKVPVLNHQRNYIIDEYLHNIDIGVLPKHGIIIYNLLDKYQQYFTSLKQFMQSIELTI